MVGRKTGPQPCSSLNPRVGDPVGHQAHSSHSLGLEVGGGCLVEEGGCGAGGGGEGGGRSAGLGSSLLGRGQEGEQA